MTKYIAFLGISSTISFHPTIAKKTVMNITNIDVKRQVNPIVRFFIYINYLLNLNIIKKDLLDSHISFWISPSNMKMYQTLLQ